MWFEQFRKNEKAQKICRVLCKIYDDTVLILCVLLLLIGAYTVYDDYMLFYHAQDRSLLKYKPGLDSGNNDGEKVFTNGYVAWLTIDDTSIDYPVMQGTDNSTFLNMDPYGEYSLSGSIFLDTRNTSDFSDNYNLLYGHHMENKYMFGALDDYLKKSFFDAHRNGKLIVISEGEKSYDLKIFAVMDTTSRSQAFEPNEKDITFEFIRENAQIYYDPVHTNSRILAMSTCQSAETTGRLIVFAEIIN